MSDAHLLPTANLPTHHPPGFVMALNGLMHRLLAIGAPLGPNALLTVRGRKSGTPYTFPVAILELDGRRFVQGAYGETNWVKNLRATGEATLSKRAWGQEFDAIELPPEVAASVLRDALAPFVSKVYARPLVWLFFRLRSGATLDDYLAVAREHPTFELRPKT